MPIAVTANSLQHCPSPSKRRHVSHTVRDGQASLSHQANTVERVIDFQFLTLGGLPLGLRSPKVEMTYYAPRSTILQNFSPIAQTVYEICVTKFFTFWSLGANPWAKVHQKGRWPGGLRDLPSCKISSLYTNPHPRYPLQKILRTHTQKNKQTVNDISTTFLSACVVNKWVWSK